MRNKSLMQQTRHKAKMLYLSKKYTSQQICKRLGITAATMSKWVSKYGWKEPYPTGVRFNLKVFGIISAEFNEFLAINNTELYKALKTEMESYIKQTSGSGAKLHAIKNEIKGFFNYPELKGQKFDGISVEKVEKLSLKKAEHLLKSLKHWDRPLEPLLIKKVTN